MIAHVLFEVGEFLEGLVADGTTCRAPQCWCLWFDDQLMLLYRSHLLTSPAARPVHIHTPVHMLLLHTQTM